MKRIAVVTTFQNVDPQYSLTGIVLDQLRSLVHAGYSTKFLTLTEFAGEVPEGVELRACIPTYTLTDYQLTTKKGGDFDEQIKGVASALTENLKDIDICITHDLMFQTWFLPHNAAVREVAARLPALRWFHWMHSAPQERPAKLEYPHTLRFSGMENAKFVYLNHWDVPRVAKAYDIPESDIRVVYNPKDVRNFFNMHPIAVDVIESYQLLEPDVLCIYPTRMSPGKQPDKALKIIAKIKEQGKGAKIVFCSSYSNAEGEKKYIEDLIKIGKKWGLADDEMVFTSRHNQQLELGVPPEVVRNLLQVSNVFILPSLSEACSLILLEAALTKNLLVLNDDFPPMREFGKEHALYFKFSSTVFKTTYHPSEEAYMGDCAKRIIAELNVNKALGAFSYIKKRFTRDWIFKNQLEPLFYES